MNDHFVARGSCPCCGRGQSREIWRASYTRAPLRPYLTAFYEKQGGVEFQYLENQDDLLRERAQCGLLFQAEIPGEALMSRIYDQWIDPARALLLYTEGRTVDTFSQVAAEMCGVLRHFGAPPGRLLFPDYSMGWRYWCKVAMAAGCRVHGSEFSQARRDWAASQGVCVIDPAEAAVNRYDLIRLEHVLKHLPDPAPATLAGLAGSLKPNRLLKIAVPDASRVKEGLTAADWQAPKSSPRSLNAVAPLEHINAFTRTSLLRLARAAGLEPVLLPRTIVVPESLRGLLAAFAGACGNRLTGRGWQALAERRSTSLMFRRAGEGSAAD